MTLQEPDLDNTSGGKRQRLGKLLSKDKKLRPQSSTSGLRPFVCSKHYKPGRVFLPALERGQEGGEEYGTS